MALEISSALRKRLCDAAKATPDVEVCGLVFGTPDRITDLAGCANVAADPRRTFEVDPAALFAALRAERGGGAPLLGYWHSHPSGDVRPSATDAARAAADSKIWLIVAGDLVGGWRAVPAGEGTTTFEPVALTVIG
jgi:proteasome lid subunit RPN8/RPN11